MERKKVSLSLKTGTARNKSKVRLIHPLHRIFVDLVVSWVILATFEKLGGVLLIYMQKARSNTNISFVTCTLAFECAKQIMKILLENDVSLGFYKNTIVIQINIKLTCKNLTIS